MYRVWVVALGLCLVPFIAVAHPGTLDGRSCHVCTDDCAQYGLRDGTYHCHLGTDRTTNIDYRQYWLFQRLLRRANSPLLRAIARRLRSAVTEPATGNAYNACAVAGATRTGTADAPLLPRYRKFGAYGELFTAFACMTPPETAGVVTADGNVHGGLRADLYLPPDAIVTHALSRAGFVCEDPDAAAPCTHWLLDVPLIPAAALRPLLPVASRIVRIDCPACMSSSSSASSRTSASVSSGSGSSVSASPPSQASAAGPSSSADGAGGSSAAGS